MRRVSLLFGPCKNGWQCTKYYTKAHKKVDAMRYHAMRGGCYHLQAPLLSSLLVLFTRIFRINMNVYIPYAMVFLAWRRRRRRRSRCSSWGTWCTSCSCAASAAWKRTTEITTVRGTNTHVYTCATSLAPCTIRPWG